MLCPSKALEYLYVLETRAQQTNDPEAFRGNSVHRNQVRYAALNSDQVAYNDYIKAFSSTDGAVAIVPISGVMMHRAGLIGDASGARDVMEVINDLEKAEKEEDIHAIVLHIDSGGGQAHGSESLAKTIKQINKKKPIVTYSDGYMASAAYRAAEYSSHIMLDENELRELTIGSIGVYMIYENVAQHLKNEGIDMKILRAKTSPEKVSVNPIEPLSAEDEKQLIAQATATHRAFRREVEEGRGEKLNLDIEGLLTGKTFDGKKAIEYGLADSKGSMDKAVRLALQLAEEKKPKTKKSNPSKSNSNMNKYLKKAASLFGGADSTIQVDFTDEEQAEKVGKALTDYEEQISELQSDVRNLQQDLFIANESLKKREETIQAQAQKIRELETELDETAGMPVKTRGNGQPKTTEEGKKLSKEEELERLGHFGSKAYKILTKD